MNTPWTPTYKKLLHVAQGEIHKKLRATRYPWINLWRLASIMNETRPLAAQDGVKRRLQHLILILLVSIFASLLILNVFSTWMAGSIALVSTFIVYLMLAAHIEFYMYWRSTSSEREKERDRLLAALDDEARFVREYLIDKELGFVRASLVGDRTLAHMWANILKQQVDAPSNTPASQPVQTAQLQTAFREPWGGTQDPAVCKERARQDAIQRVRWVIVNGPERLMDLEQRVEHIAKTAEMMAQSRRAVRKKATNPLHRKILERGLRDGAEAAMNTVVAEFLADTRDLEREIYAATAAAASLLEKPKA